MLWSRELFATDITRVFVVRFRAVSLHVLRQLAVFVKLFPALFTGVDVNILSVGFHYLVSVLA